MKKKLLNAVLVLFVVALGVVACSDSQDIEPIEFDSDIEKPLNDKLEDRPDTGDIVG